MKRTLFNFITILSLISLWSCKEFDTNPKGLLNVILIDSPAQWDSVFVEILGVDVELIASGKDEGTIETYFLPYAPGEKKIEVSSLIGGEALLLGRDELASGKVLKLNIKLGDEHYLYLDEKRYSLALPDPSSPDIELEFEMDIDQGLSHDIVLDFDLEKSIKIATESPLTFQFNPVIKAIPGAGTGEISGTISPTTLQSAIFAIQDGDSVNTHSNTSGTYNLRLPEGIYSLYFDPKNDSYADTTINDVEVIAGETTTLDLVTLKLKP